MDYALTHARAGLVQKYRQNKRLWPDGIDHAGNRWYGDGSAWSVANVELWASPRWLDDRMRDLEGKRVVRPIMTALKGGPVTRVTPSVTASHVTQDVTQDVTLVTQPSLADVKRAQARARMARMRARAKGDV
jgi:hypothetical protein